MTVHELAERHGFGLAAQAVDRAAEADLHTPRPTMRRPAMDMRGGTAATPRGVSWIALAGRSGGSGSRTEGADR